MATATLSRHRKIKIVLAAFAVLGIGAAATSAVWSDDVFFKGTVATDTFNLQGSIDGTAYEESNVGVPTTSITLTFPGVTLVPGTPQTVTGWVKNVGTIPATLTAPVVTIGTNPFTAHLTVVAGAYDPGAVLAPNGVATFVVTLTLDNTTPVNLSGQAADFSVQVTGTSAEAPVRSMVAVMSRRGLLPRAAAVVLVSAALVAVPVARASAAPEGSADPAVVTFGVMQPGELQQRPVTLTAPPGITSDVLRIRTSGTGTLLASVLTGVSSCAVPWSGGTCPTGALALTDGSGTVPVDRSIDVPIPADGRLYLLVSLQLAADAPPASSAEITYVLSLAERPGGSLAVTGVDVTAAAVAALALAGLGWSLVAWARRRRATA